MSSRKVDPSARANTSLPAGIQEGSRQAIPIFGQVDTEDGRGANGEGYASGPHARDELCGEGDHPASRPGSPPLK